MKRLALALVLVVCDNPSTELAPTPLRGCLADVHQQTSLGFHGGPARLGWDSQETTLTPSAVASSFGLSWSSPPFDSVSVEGIAMLGRAFASLLYADDMTIHGGPYDGAQVSALYAASSNGFVYAINAFAAPCNAGTLTEGAMLWRTSLVSPSIVPALDGGVALGTLSTPVLDLHASPPTLYVTAMDSENGSFVWRAFALDAQSGAILPGWPVTLDQPSVQALDGNGPAFFDDDARIMSQRGALALSPEGDRLYVTFGGYWDGAVGWIVAIDTHAQKLVASFSGAPDTLIDAQGNLSRHPNAGMWGPSGPAVDSHGEVYMTTGNGDEGWETSAHAWGNSLLRWTKDLVLDATYTPYNFCTLDNGDVDVGGSGAMLVPNLSSLQTTTPNLVAMGGKQGVVYLLDATNIAGSLASRPPCSTSWDDPSRDLSLLPPTADGNYCDFGPHAQCTPPGPWTTCVPGPVVAFGPAGDVADVDHAKMRTTFAYYQASDGTPYLYVSGSTKSALCAIDDVPPSLIRLRIATNAQGAAYLVRDAADTVLKFLNPGSAVVTSHGGADPIVWVVDENARRTALLTDPTTPHAVLYGVDGTTMALLYRSNELEAGGKYTTPVIAHGTVFVATDRVQAFSVQ